MSENVGSRESDLRVVHVINGLTTGGAETVLYRLTTYPSEIEHEVICLERPASYSVMLEARGIRVHHLNWTVPEASPRAWMRLRRLIKQSGADVVQAWMYRSNILAGIAGKSAGVPVIWNIRCSSVKLLRPATRVLARVGGLLSGWIPARTINCSAASAELHAKLGYDPAGVVVIPNGYDADEFRPDEQARKKTRSDLGVDPGVFLIGSFGRWQPQKGHSVLLQALASLREKGLPLRLLLTGPGLEPSNANLMRLIEESGCAHLVHAIGERRDVAALARALDLHVLPSLTEGFPNVVAETMLSGTPNVATDVGDSRFIVGDTGWIVPASDAEQFAAAIERAHAEWSASPDRWHSRQEAARSRIADNFSLGRMVAGYEEVWKRAAALASPNAAAEQANVRKGADAEPLRVLHVINSLTLGGAEALLYRVASRDTANEHVVVSLGGPAWYSRRLEENGVRVRHIGMDSTSAFPAGFMRLRRVIRDSGADVVHCWMYRSNVVGGFLAKRAGRPVVWAIHSSSLEPLRPSSRAVVRLGGVLAGSTPDFIINCSTRSAQLHAPLGYSAGEGAVIHNGYDASIWFPDETARANVRGRLGVGDREFVIGSVARWDPLKDIPNLLAALRIAHDRGVPLRCFLIGAGLGAENSALRDAIQRNRCEEVVVPLGERSDVQDMARAIDLHVLASRTEAFPNVVAETMLSGTPNVVTDVGDAALMVGASGWVVPPRDPERLVDAIIEAHREWKDKPAEWSARRTAAREQIAANFSFESMVEAYRQVWRKVAGRGVSHASLSRAQKR